MKLIYKKLLNTFMLGIFLTCSSAICLANEKQVDFEHCYVSKVKDNRIGYSCTTQSTVKDSFNSVVITKKYSEQKFRRFGFDVKLVQDVEFVEDINGKPLALTAKITSLGENTVIKAEFSPKSIKVLTNTNGTEEKEKFI